MENMRQQASEEAIRPTEDKVSKKFEEERGSNEKFKEEVEAKIESHLETATSQLKKT